MSDITIQVPFTIAALPGEAPEATAARVRLGLEAAGCYINRVRGARENAQISDTPFPDDAARIAAVHALPQEALVGLVVGELRAHVSELIIAESAYRADLAAAAARAATQAQVEASFG